MKKQTLKGFALEDRGPLLLNARVYAITEQYNIPDLKTLAAEKYKVVVKEGWNSASFCGQLEAYL